MESQMTPTGGNAVSQAVVEQLARTKGWTRFFSVMLWIGAAFLILAALAVMTMGTFMGGMGGDAGGMLAGAGMGIAMGVFYIIFSILYIYPALKLGGYSSRINDLISNPVEQNLVAALNEQRAFWKYVGICMILMIALYLVAIVVAIAIPAIVGASGGFTPEKSPVEFPQITN